MQGYFSYKTFCSSVNMKGRNTKSSHLQFSSPNISKKIVMGWGCKRIADTSQKLNPAPKLNHHLNTHNVSQVLPGKKLQSGAGTPMCDTGSLTSVLLQNNHLPLSLLCVNHDINLIRNSKGA